MLWESPVYRFRISEDTDNEESEDLKEIVIDVTLSAPSFQEPSDNLKYVLKEIFKSSSLKKIDTVLEFGAAKLKNIPFILEQGKKVCAVEFRELTENPITKGNIKKCEKYGGNFQKLIFPNPFISDTRKFDLVLLANVLPVMPVFAERMFTLQLLYDKIKEKKYLLWIAQKEGSYKKIRETGNNNCGDGIWMGTNRRLKTFYKYHHVDELDEMMALYGLERIKIFGVGDDARLYQKKDYDLFSGILTQEKIIQYIKSDESIKNPDSPKLKIVKRSIDIKPIIPNPKELSMESFYIERLREIEEGPDNAELYHRLVSNAIGRIFRGSLRNMTIKQDLDSGIKIIDTLFTNCAENGFFKTLQSKVDCIYPIVEVKNFSDPKNPDLDQVNGRLNANTGKFGILVCRSVSDEERVYRRTQTFLPDHLILFLTDNDIIELLEYRREGNLNEINDFMDDKLKKLLFKSTK